MSRRALLGATAAAVVVAGLAVVFASRFGSDPTLAPSPLVGGPAPEIAVTNVESGESVSIGDFTGIVVVNFWAPWCVPCRAEHSELVAAAERYGSAGVTILGIAYDSREADVVAFLDELGRGYPVAMDGNSRAAIAFGVRGVPETFFVGGDGTVVAKVNGPVDAALLTSTLDSMLIGEALTN